MDNKNRPDFWLYGNDELPIFISCEGAYYRVVDWEESELPTDWFAGVDAAHAGQVATVQYGDGTTVQVTLPVGRYGLPIRVNKGG